MVRIFCSKLHKISVEDKSANYLNSACIDLTKINNLRIIFFSIFLLLKPYYFLLDIAKNFVICMLIIMA